MAGVRGKLVTPEIATGTAAKTLLQLIAASNHRVILKGFGVSFKGVTTTDPPVFVRLLRQTTAGTGTTNNPVKVNSSDDETLQTTGTRAMSAEPTASDVLWSGEVHPQNAHAEWFPWGEEIVIPGGGRVGLEVTSSVSVSALAHFSFEE
jgi:hypothetical protein